MLHMLLIQQARQYRLLLRQRARCFSRFAAQRFGALRYRARGLFEAGEFAIGVGNGALRFAQRIGGFATRFFAAGDLFLQRLNSAAQLLEFFFGPGGIARGLCYAAYA